MLYSAGLRTRRSGEVVRTADRMNAPQPGAAVPQDAGTRLAAASSLWRHGGQGTTVPKPSGTEAEPEKKSLPSQYT
jgi:hypothetical protein